MPLRAKILLVEVDQLAQTRISRGILNDGEGVVEGTFKAEW